HRRRQGPLFEPPKKVQRVQERAPTWSPADRDTPPHPAKGKRPVQQVAERNAKHRTSLVRACGPLRGIPRGNVRSVGAGDNRMAACPAVRTVGSAASRSTSAAVRWSTLAADAELGFRPCFSSE